MLKKELNKDVKYTGNDRYEGFCIDLLKEIARIVGFDYQIQVVPDGRYGVRNSDGEWDGIVRELIDRVTWHFPYHARIQGGGGDRGSRPPEKSQKYRVS